MPREIKPIAHFSERPQCFLRTHQSATETQSQAATAAIAPATGAVKYIHRCSKCAETSAGASERAGFIDAPEIGPANSASKAIRRYPPDGARATGAGACAGSTDCVGGETFIYSPGI